MGGTVHVRSRVLFTARKSYAVHMRWTLVPHHRALVSEHSREVVGDLTTRRRIMSMSLVNHISRRKTAVKSPATAYCLSRRLPKSSEDVNMSRPIDTSTVEVAQSRPGLRFSSDQVNTLACVTGRNLEMRIEG